MAQNVRSINGANALIKVTDSQGNTQIVGYATGVSVTESFILNRIDVLGQIDSKDIEPIARTVTGTISIMRMTAHVAAAPGDAFIGGGAAYNALVPSHNPNATDIERTQDVMNFMNNGFDLVLEDSAGFDPQDTAQTRYEVKGCRPTTHTFALNRGSIMGVDIGFEALKLTESDTTRPIQ